MMKTEYIKFVNEIKRIKVKPFLKKCNKAK